MHSKVNVTVPVASGRKNFDPSLPLPKALPFALTRHEFAFIATDDHETIIVSPFDARLGCAMIVATAGDLAVAVEAALPLFPRACRRSRDAVSSVEVPNGESETDRPMGTEN